MGLGAGELVDAEIGRGHAEQAVCRGLRVDFAEQGAGRAEVEVRAGGILALHGEISQRFVTAATEFGGVGVGDEFESGLQRDGRRVEVALVVLGGGEPVIAVSELEFVAGQHDRSLELDDGLDGGVGL